MGYIREPYLGAYSWPPYIIVNRDALRMRRVARQRGYLHNTLETGYIKGISLNWMLNSFSYVLRVSAYLLGACV